MKDSFLIYVVIRFQICIFDILNTASHIGGDEACRL